MLKTLLIIALSIALHELGHYLTARIFKQKVLSVQLFLFPVLYVYLKGTLYKVGLVPVIGYVNAPGVYSLSTTKQIIYFLSGITVNALLLFVPDPVVRAVNLYTIIFSLIPFKRSDGRNIWIVLKKGLHLCKPK